MRVRSPHLVGRQLELGRLSGLLTDATHGKPGVVIVGGEAGVGKSRLIEEFCRLAVEQDARCLLGAAADLGQGVPYGPLVSALRSVVRDDSVASQLGHARRELGPLFPPSRS